MATMTKQTTMTKQARRQTQMLAIAAVLGVLAITLLSLVGCRPCKTFNPAMSPPQCQACRTESDGSTTFYGPILKASECAGEPTPKVEPTETPEVPTA